MTAAPGAAPGAGHDPPQSGWAARRSHAAELRVALFCGGRGSAAIVREFMRRPEIRLSLLVNAYDDGLSTGELREFIPDMLGPSDFRKNLSYLLDLHSSEQYALQRIFEYRLPADFSGADAARLRSFADCGGEALPVPLRGLFEALTPALSGHIRAHLSRFFEYHGRNPRGLKLPDCALGNLIFAGCYLGSNYDFNASIRRLAEFVGSRAELINVTRGENRTLAALKENGEILCRESEIAGPQSDSPIRGIFLLKRPLMASERANLEGLNAEEKLPFLRRLEAEVDLSPDAARALLGADAIVYGPGTQYSSLLPSYCTRGIADAIRRSRARHKIFVANLDTDHDIQSLTALDLVDKALEIAGDPENRGGLITHVLCNRGHALRPRGLPIRRAGRGAGIHSGAEIHKGCRIVEGDLENPSQPSVHSGYAVVERVLAIERGASPGAERPRMDIYVDLLARSQAAGSLLQEALELPWRESLESVRLTVNGLGERPAELPAYLQLAAARMAGPFSEVDALREWLERGESEYLATITGDGEYRLRDLFLALQVAQGGGFGLVCGSRTQSRRQFHSALRSAYGEGGWLYWLSWLGAFVFTALFGLCFRTILSDPLTGFRLYRRDRLRGTFGEAFLRRRTTSAAAVTKLLIRHGVEIAEIPVTYRTFRGFTRASWRVGRGLRNLLGLLR